MARPLPVCGVIFGAVEVEGGAGSMVVGTAEVELNLPGATSLKAKRGIVKSLVTRAHRQFPVAVAEVAALDEHRRTVIGIACVSNSRTHAEQMLSRIIDWLERETSAAGFLGAYHIEIL